jgi:osmotically-inducible protein OsmY
MIQQETQPAKLGTIVIKPDTRRRTLKDKYDSSLIGPAEASLFRSDDQIRKDVENLISVNDDIFPKDIDINVKQGIVTLKGGVNSTYARNAAEEAAREVLGVTDVKNELDVTG